MCGFLSCVGLRLRSKGYVEVNGLHDAKDLQPNLIKFLESKWGCTEPWWKSCGFVHL